MSKNSPTQHMPEARADIGLFFDISEDHDGEWKARRVGGGRGIYKRKRARPSDDSIMLEPTALELIVLEATDCARSD